LLISADGHPDHTSSSTPQENKADSRIAGAATIARILKKSMRDPDSFKLESVLIMDTTGSVCYKYRARNGFNGLNVEQAVLSSKGKFKTSDMDGFTSLWNRECAHKTGSEEVQNVSFLLDHLD